MHIDARTLPNGSVLEADLCIVGAGAAGISMALEWIGSRHKVLLLEGGGLDYEAAMQDLYRGESVGLPYYPLQAARLHYFGGTTGHWAGFCSTLDPIDFEKRAWVPHSGWPIRREDLDPFYARAQPLLELGPYEYGAGDWQRRDPTLVPLPLDPRVMWTKMWQFSPPTRFGARYRAAVIGAPNVHLYTHANVCELEANESLRSIEGLRIRTLDGKELRARARYYALEFGRTKARGELALSAAVQREQRILNATVSLEPGGPDEVAQSTFEWGTPDRLAAMRERDAHGNAGPPPAGLAEQPPPASAPLFFHLMTRQEQAPNPASRVLLSTERDALDMPRAKLDWRLTALDRRSFRAFYEVMGRELGRSGAGRVQLLDWVTRDEDTWPGTLSGGWHHMGTTRMNENPRLGVVDANCRVHGLGNLYVAGASVYPTGGAANPTLTLVAVSRRLSDHLKRTLA